jgi:hypothetical protein
MKAATRDARGVTFAATLNDCRLLAITNLRRLLAASVSHHRPRDAVRKNRLRLRHRKSHFRDSAGRQNPLPSFVANTREDGSALRADPNPAVPAAAALPGRSARHAVGSGPGTSPSERAPTRPKASDRHRLGDEDSRRDGGAAYDPCVPWTEGGYGCDNCGAVLAIDSCFNCGRMFVYTAATAERRKRECGDPPLTNDEAAKSSGLCDACLAEQQRETPAQVRQAEIQQMTCPVCHTDTLS